MTEGNAQVERLAAALNDVLEKTTWEGRGKNIAPALMAALQSRGVSVGEAAAPLVPAPETPPQQARGEQCVGAAPAPSSTPLGIVGCGDVGEEWYAEQKEADRLRVPPLAPAPGYKSVRQVMRERGQPEVQDKQFHMDDVAAAPFADDGVPPLVPAEAPDLEALRARLVRALFEILSKSRLVETDRKWCGEQFVGAVYGVRPDDWTAFHAELDEVVEGLRIRGAGEGQ